MKMYTWAAACALCLMAVQGMAQSTGQGAAAASESVAEVALPLASAPAAQASGADPTPPTRDNGFVLAPHLEHLPVCDAAQADPTLTTMAQVVRVCQGLGGSSVQTLSRVLDALEPSGAQGEVQVGYTLTLPLLGLMRQEGDDWVMDESRLRPMLDLIEQVDRPVVVYLSSSHFDTIGRLPEVLREDPRNFMQFADGSVPQLGYFGYPISAYTLRTDPSIAVNHYRFKALRELSAHFAKLSEAAKSRIVGYTLGGEFHHMYPDFEGGAGTFGAVTVTDYSPESVALFRDWLRDKWGSARRFASASGLKVEDFNEIDAPRGHLGKGTAKHLREHYDAYAAGHVPIAGWLHDPKQRISKLTLFLNGKPVGDVQQGFNRLDVYRAKAEVLNPNVGFRHDLDVSTLAAGPYLAQVVALVEGRQYELAQTRFTLAGRSSGEVRAKDPQGARKLQFIEPEGNWFTRWWRGFLRTIGLDRSLPNYARVAEVEHYLDLPEKDLVVHYNPLAREWDEFRNAQVLGYMQALYEQAVAAGFPSDMLYSHQLNDRVNSAWNPQLFAVDAVWAKPQAWHNGMNLYGGATSSDMVLRFIERSKREFAVPEFHTQQWKVKDGPLNTLKGLKSAGARFVSPYYLTLVPPQLRIGQEEHGVNRMELDPSNPKDGSDLLYQALQEFAKQ